MAQWRVTAHGERQWLGHDGAWYASPELAQRAFPAVYRRPEPPRRRRHVWRWVLLGVVGFVVLAAGTLLAVTRLLLTPSGPSLSGLQASILTHAQHAEHLPATSASCVMPSSWASGQTFHCFVYRGSVQIAAVTGTVTPSVGSTWTWNEAWSAATT